MLFLLIHICANRGILQKQCQLPASLLKKHSGVYWEGGRWNIMLKKSSLQEKHINSLQPGVLYISVPGSFIRWARKIFKRWVEKTPQTEIERNRTRVEGCAWEQIGEGFEFRLVHESILIITVISVNVVTKSKWCALVSCLLWHVCLYQPASLDTWSHPTHCTWGGCHSQECMLPDTVLSRRCRGNFCLFAASLGWGAGQTLGAKLSSVAELPLITILSWFLRRHRVQREGFSSGWLGSTTHFHASRFAVKKGLF